MSQFESEIAGTAQAFAEISSRAAVAGNIQRAQIAQTNISTGTAQIRLEETAARRSIARQLASYQGSQAAARAFRGTGGGDIGSGAALSDAATAQAADQVALVEANAAAKEAALIASNQFITEDPVLAAIQGGVQGLEIGTNIAQSLINEGEVRQRQSSQQVGNTGAGGGPTLPTFSNTITTILDIPGLDLTELFGDLFPDNP
jgi:hypothetical protein